jgi:asparagine synthase (glutamine-hydrolysing)
MCGIAGIYVRGGGRPEHAELTAMTAAIAHRGPDDDGVYIDGPVGLGHRRLSIIDLSPEAAQPMFDVSGRLAIIYNGEIYNYRELRRELTSLGHLFKTRSDTEVILEAYKEWPQDWVLHLNGIFAIALWDRAAGRLLLARDRLGIKPLYYLDSGSQLAFASEIKAILVVARHGPRLNPYALRQYFTFQNVLTDETFFEGVRLVPPAHLLTIGADGVRAQVYWELSWQKRAISPTQWVEEVGTTFQNAVQRQLVSDVPVGSFLSGGMDSASIATVASRHMPGLTTFTGGFDLSEATGREVEFDERDDADVVANAIGSDHYTMLMHAGDMIRALPRLTWHLEDLRVGMSYQNFYISRLASRFVKVALAGVGGDELFGGYPWRYAACTEPGQREFEETWYRYWCRLVPDSNQQQFFSAETWAKVRDRSPYETFRAIMNRGRGLDQFDQAFGFELRTFLHGLLVVEDKVSMAHALEVRVPFLDNDLIDLALSMPADLKLRDGEGKWVLRRALADVLPERIVRKRKQGFSPPEGSWYRGVNREYVRGIILGGRARERGIFNMRAIEHAFEDHLDGRIDNRLLLWSLISFEWWCRIFIDGDRPCVSEADLGPTQVACCDLCLHAGHPEPRQTQWRAAPTPLPVN